MIKCSNCMTEKPISEYSESKNSSTGKQNMCKPCYKAYHEAWRASRKALPASVHTQSKVCVKCGLEKPRSQFGKKSINLDKLNEHCKECWREICKHSQREYHKRKRANV